MTDHLRLQHNSRLKKLVSNARAIITNQIALPLGALKMERILYWVNQIEQVSEIDLQIFSEYNSKTIHFLIGTERLHCEKEFLKQQDKQLDELTMQYKDEIIDKCFEIVDRFADNKN
ncbi:MAG: DUF2489 domain-containing protein [Bacteroidetes bacterium]|nr:DUF2489 domain-containing protein [Bacteroidota bacterium]